VRKRLRRQATTDAADADALVPGHLRGHINYISGARRVQLDLLSLSSFCFIARVVQTPPLHPTWLRADDVCLQTAFSSATSTLRALSKT
jgi:hypothetical protein